MDEREVYHRQWIIVQFNLRTIDDQILKHLTRFSRILLFHFLEIA